VLLWEVTIALTALALARSGLDRRPTHGGDAE
jgi:hypothetical protein